MWGGQSQPAWGWSPNLSNQDCDPSQGWAAAAALWAQQRQLQHQCQIEQVPPKFEKPPEPPGPPPVRPPLPSMDGTTLTVQSIKVHDYMHGKEPFTQATEVIDYQHGQVLDPIPAAGDYKREVDENLVEWEVTSDNWQDHHALFYNGGWTQDGWNGDQMSYYAAAAQHYQNEYNSTTQAPDIKRRTNQRSSCTSSGSQGTEKYSQYDNKSTFPVPQPKVSADRMAKENTMNTTGMETTEVSRRAKVLPLWLRQGLEKMEQDKKKLLEKNKAKEDVLSISMEWAGDKMSMKSTGGMDKDNGEMEKEKGGKEPSVKTAGKSDDEPASVSVSDEEDEEERFQQLMFKVKTWMTEILLGVTNAEIRDVCKEVYFELKRSAKAKATQLRRSGGLDALRSVGKGTDIDITSTESESEDEMKLLPKVLDGKMNEITDSVDRSIGFLQQNELWYNLENSHTNHDSKEANVIKQSANKSLGEFSESFTVQEKCHNEQMKLYHHKYGNNQHSSSTTYQTVLPGFASLSPGSHISVPKCHWLSATTPSSSSENESHSQYKSNKYERKQICNEHLRNYKKMAIETLNEKQRQSSSSGEDGSYGSVGIRESEECNSAGSEDNTLRKSNKRWRSNRSESSSPQCHKKSKHRKDTSNNDADNARQRKRKGSSTSTDSEPSSSHQKRRSTSKKHKRRTISHSRSRSKRKR